MTLPPRALQGRRVTVHAHCSRKWHTPAMRSSRCKVEALPRRPTQCGSAERIIPWPPRPRRSWARTCRPPRAPTPAAKLAATFNKGSRSLCPAHAMSLTPRVLCWNSKQTDLPCPPVQVDLCGCEPSRILHLLQSLEDRLHAGAARHKTPAAQHEGRIRGARGAPSPHGPITWGVAGCFPNHQLQGR